jgi:hypothetical protein
MHEARNIEFFEHYKAGTLDIHAFLDFQLAPLARHPREQLDAWHAEFLATRIRPLIGPAARSLVESHAEAGDLMAIVTATNSFVTGPIAREFGIPHLIATIPAQEDGRFTGKPRGLPSFREGKITRVEAWLESLGTVAGRLRAKLVLQRFTQRPASAGTGHPSGRRRCRRHAGAQAADERDWLRISLRASYGFGYTPPPANAVKLVFTAAFSETWPSGRRHTPAKGASGQNLDPGFESLRLRQSNRRVLLRRIEIESPPQGAFVFSAVSFRALSDICHSAANAPRIRRATRGSRRESPRRRPGTPPRHPPGDWVCVHGATCGRGRRRCPRSGHSCGTSPASP